MVGITPFLRFSNKQRILLEKETNNIFTESMRTIVDVHLTGSEGYFEENNLGSPTNSVSSASLRKAKCLSCMPG